MSNEIRRLLKEAFAEVGPTPSESTVRARARRQQKARLLGGSASVVAVVLVGTLLAVRQAPQGSRVATDGLAAATSSIAAAAPDAGSHAPQASSSSSSNVSGSTNGSIVSTSPVTLPPTTLPGHSPSPPPPVFTPPPSGTRLYFLAGGSDIVSTRLDGSDRVVVLSGYAGIPVGIWPDGSKLLMGTTQGGGASIVSLNLRTGERRTILQRNDNDLGGVDLSPDGARIAYSVDSGRIQTSLTPYKSPYDVHIVNVDGSGDRVLVPGDRPLWAADGGTLLIQHCGENSGARPCTIKPDGSAQQTLNSFPYQRAFAWSPDGTWLAGHDVDGRLSVARLDGSQKRTIGKAMGSSPPAWTPDGARIVYERLPEGRNPSTGECGSGCDGVVGLASAAFDGSGEFGVTTTTNDGYPVIG